MKPGTQVWGTTVHTSTNTHTRLMALCLGLHRWAGTRKVKPIWIYWSKRVSGSGISWAVCKSASCSRQKTTPVWKHGRHSHKKIGEIAPRWFHQTTPKRCFDFSVIDTTQPFGHLFCADLDHVWNNRRESFFWSMHLWEISEFLHRDFASPQKLAPRSAFFGRVLVSCYQCTGQPAQFWAVGLI